jgi:signal peptide peptidase SppA
MRYASIVRAVFGSVWAILPEKLEAIAAFVQMKSAGGTADPSVITFIREENKATEARRLAIGKLVAFEDEDVDIPVAARTRTLQADKPGSVAVLPLYGIINQRYSGDFSGPQGTSVQEFTQQFRTAMNDPNVKAIVIDVDSPGGTVSGVDELATEIYNARKQGTKKITAVSNCLMASAAYYIASQANELCVSPSSLTGSIGVYSLHEDDSTALENLGVKFTFVSAGKYKVEGNNYQPLDDEARAAMQGVVDDFYDLFTKAVARGRGVAVKNVRNGFGEGRVLTANDAVKQGLADRVATLDDVLSKYGVKPSQGAASSQSGAAAAETQPAIVAMGSSRGEDDTIDQYAPACTCECEECIEGDCSECTHEGCDPEAEGCEGCGMMAAAQTKTAQAAAEARARRLRLARL